MGGSGWLAGEGVHAVFSFYFFEMRHGGGQIESRWSIETVEFLP